MFRGIPIDRRSDYYTGRGILEWRQGDGYTHGPGNPVTRTFATRQARDGWLRKIRNRLVEDWYLMHEIDATNPLKISVWIEEIQ